MAVYWIGVGAERSWRVNLLGIITPARMMGGLKMTPQFLAWTGVSWVEEFGGIERRKGCVAFVICYFCRWGFVRKSSA